MSQPTTPVVDGKEWPSSPGATSVIEKSKSSRLFEVRRKRPATCAPATGAPSRSCTVTMKVAGCPTTGLYSQPLRTCQPRCC